MGLFFCILHKFYYICDMIQHDFNKELTTWEKISLWWRFDGKYTHYKVYNGVKNLIKWFKIVWKDRDYDQSFIFDVLKFKIENTANYTESRKWFVGWENEVSRMRTCVKLIQRIQDDFYNMEHMDFEDRKFTFVPTEDKDENGDCYYSMESEVLRDELEEYFKKYPNTYNKVIKKNGEDLPNHLIATQMGRMNHEKAKKLLFNILNKHIEHWWD